MFIEVILITYFPPLCYSLFPCVTWHHNDVVVIGVVDGFPLLVLLCVSMLPKKNDINSKRNMSMLTYEYLKIKLRARIEDDDASFLSSRRCLSKERKKREYCYFCCH